MNVLDIIGVIWGGSIALLAAATVACRFSAGARRALIGETQRR